MRPRVLVWSWLLVFPMMSGCATGGGGTVGRDAAASHVRSGVAAARAEAREAAQAGQRERLFELLHDDAWLITPSGDSIHGRDRITMVMDYVHPGLRTAVLDMVPRRVDVCTNGAHESGGSYVLVLDRGTAADTIAGRYAMRWRRDDLGGYRVASIDTRRGMTDRPPGLAECPQLHAQRLARRRFEVSGYTPGLGAFDGWNMHGSLADELRGRGYTHSINRSSIGFTVVQQQIREDRSLSAFALIGYRVAPTWTVEALGGWLSKGSMVAFNPTAERSIELEYEGSLAGALLVYRHGWVRLGAGPGMARYSAESHERSWPGNSGGGTVGRNSSTGSTIGALADLSLRVPTSDRVFLQGRSQYRVFGDAEIDLHGIGPTKVAQGGMLFGLNVGMAF